MHLKNSMNDKHKINFEQLKHLERIGGVIGVPDYENAPVPYDKLAVDIPDNVITAWEELINAKNNMYNIWKYCTEVNNRG
jgi:hypothetical protein